MEKLQNKVISPKVVLEFAEQLHNRFLELKQKSDICIKENEAKDYNEQFFETVVTFSDLRFSVYYANDTKEERENFEWFKDILTNHAKEISGVNITYSCNYNKNSKHKYGENERKEHFRLHLDATKHYCFGDLDISYSDNNDEFQQIARQINLAISNCPDRYDNIFKKKGLYRTFPSFAVSMILSLIICAGLFILAKLSVLPESFSNYVLQNPIILIAGGLGVTILLGFILPNANIEHYKKLIVDKKYDHYDTNWKIEHYENDFERYKSQVEFSVGKFYQSDKTRAKIRKNFKLSAIIFSIGFVLFAVLAIVMFL